VIHQHKMTILNAKCLRIRESNANQFKWNKFSKKQVSKETRSEVGSKKKCWLREGEVNLVLPDKKVDRVSWRRRGNGEYDFPNY